MRLWRVLQGVFKRVFKGDLEADLEGDLEVDLEGEIEGDSKRDFKQEMSGLVQVWSRSGPGLVQVWFWLQLKFYSFELDSEVGRLVVIYNLLHLRTFNFCCSQWK